MPNAASRILITTIDEAFSACAETIIAPFDWQIRHASDANSAAEMLTRCEPAALLLDARLADAAAVISTVRQLPPPLNGTPIIAVGEIDGGVAGAGGKLESPLGEDALVAILRRWAGPLTDHAARSLPWSFRYRLTRLLGLDAADGMLARLRDQLCDAIEPAGDEPISAHRLAGIAGMCGFPELSAQWNAADRGESGALPAAIEASRDAVAEIDRALSAT